jgi:hypothetical protein
MSAPSTNQRQRVNPGSEEHGHVLRAIIEYALAMRFLWLSDRIFVYAPACVMCALALLVAASLLTHGSRLAAFDDAASLLAVGCLAVAALALLLATYVASRTYWELNLFSQLAVLVAVDAAVRHLHGQMPWKVMVMRLLLAALATSFFEFIAAAWELRRENAETVHRLKQISRVIGITAALLTLAALARLYT